jgi:hypothetical protein
MNWIAKPTPVIGGQRFGLHTESGPLKFTELLDAWEQEPEFAAWYSRLLADSPCDAVFWEHPPLTPDRLRLPAEFVLLDAPALVSFGADPRAFSRHFQSASDTRVATFANLGGDALLVAPLPTETAANYAHLAAFARSAPPEQIRSFWQAVGRAVRRSVSRNQPLWLSTSGLGVAWLHARLDTTPKYYQHAPYRSWPPDTSRGPGTGPS